MWPKILEILSGLILGNYCVRCSYAMPFWISFRIFLLQNFKFAYCLRSFRLRIALNLYKYALFWSYRTHVLPFYQTWLWYFSDVNFCMTCFFLFLHLHMFGFSKGNNAFFYLKLDVLYSSANYPHRETLPEK